MLYLFIEVESSNPSIEFLRVLYQKPALYKILLSLIPFSLTVKANFEYLIAKFQKKRRKGKQPRALYNA